MGPATLIQSGPTRSGKFRGASGNLANNDLVHPNQAQYIARLLVEKVEIEEVVRQAPGLVSHQCNFGLQPIAFRAESLRLGVDLDTLKQAEIALHAGKVKYAARTKLIAK